MPVARHPLNLRRPRRGLRWVAGALGLGLAGTAALVAAMPAGAYTAGNDSATFTVNGVVDSNCPVSVGGTEIWIKPGDGINFTSALAGLSLAGIGLNTGMVAGLDVTATIDAGLSTAQTITVTGSKAAPLQRALATGDHKITWTATGVQLLPAVLGGIQVPLSVSALQSGASLNWAGVIHVTSTAATCKLAVAVPQVPISVGPIKVTVPPINVAIPVPSVPALPGLPGTKTTAPSTGGSTAAGTTAGGGASYTPPGETVPDQVVPQGSSGGSGLGGTYGSSLGGGGYGSILGLPSSNDGVNALTNGTPKTAAQTTKQVDLSSNKLPTAQMPVLLAILAIAALALVSGSYARLYLLRRSSL